MGKSVLGGWGGCGLGGSGGGGRSTPRATNAALLAMERQQQTQRQNMSELLARVQQMEGSMVDVCDSHAADTVRQRSIRRHQPASHTSP